MKKFVVVSLSVLLFLGCAVELIYAHGVIGRRFIPTSIVVDDPFASDEMDLLKVLRGSKNDEGRETSVGFEFSKRLTPDFALTVGWDYLFFNPRGAGESSVSGAGNPEFGVKYVSFRSPEHEGIFSVGLGVEAGGVGSQRVAERVTTISPTLFFGKGFGDLPDSLAYLKPFSINGQFNVNNPANRTTGSGDDKEHNPTTIDYGVAVMYSIPYLQSFVKDVGLGAPFDRLFPIVEFNFTTNASKPNSGQTTAFANPGLLWVGRYIELGLEAKLPMTNVSGKNAGVNGLIHVFIDDLWPNIFTWTPGGVIGPTGMPK